MNELLSRTLSFGIAGVNGFPVHVEAFGINGLPGMEIIGLPDVSVRESRDRVNAAIISSGRQMRPKRITINLAPADMRKEGPSFDLPIALSVMIASGELIPSSDFNFDNTAFFGELSLNGSVQPISGALPMVICAKENGIENVILPEKNAREVACIQNINIFPVSHLTEVIDHIEGSSRLQQQVQQQFESLRESVTPAVDMAQIRGQMGARRALEVAAAGGHNMLMIGVPGSGKTMLARCLPGILPTLSFEEALETTRIHSISGKLKSGTGLVITRPFRAPHHNASVASLIGGGQNALPGEVSLAHNGVLFLDELPEFGRNALEALRQPLEDRFVTVTRVMRQAEYQSSFMLVAAMNPCPCGYYGSVNRPCRCTPQEIRRYLDKISGPLLDRIDIQIEVDAVPVHEITSSAPSESSAQVAARVKYAREIQQDRYRGCEIHCNSQLGSDGIKKYCVMDRQAEQLVSSAIDAMQLSMRAHNRIMKVARTIADLDGSETIKTQHAAEAVQYRELDQKYWR